MHHRIVLLHGWGANATICVRLVMPFQEHPSPLDVICLWAPEARPTSGRQWYDLFPPDGTAFLRQWYSFAAVFSSLPTALILWRRPC